MQVAYRVDDLECSAASQDYPAAVVEVQLTAAAGAGAAEVRACLDLLNTGQACSQALMDHTAVLPWPTAVLKQTRLAKKSRQLLMLSVLRVVSSKM